MTYWHLKQIGSGLFSDPFRPEGMAAQTWGSWQQPDGSFILWTDDVVTPVSATKQVLGGTLDEASSALGISAQDRGALA